MAKYKNYIIWGIIALVVIIIVSTFVGSYNGMVGRETEIEGRWANVETQYQRRLDLFKNLVNTVKGYADHEQQTLIGVIEARANTMRMNLTADDLTDENLRKFQVAQAEMSQGLGRLLAIGESYPDLKASQNFVQLQDEVAGTENRIAKARTDYNNAVKEYNLFIRRFPRNMFAGMYGFEKKAMFEAQQGAEVAPDIAF